MLTSRSIYSLLFAAALALAAVAPRALCAQGTEIVRGKVLDTQKKPVAGVDVIITGQATGLAQTTKTDAKGEYTAVFRDAEGAYTLSFRKVGYGAFTRTAKLAGLSNIIDVPDAVLPGGLQVLQPLTATTMLKVPAAGEFPSIGGAELNTSNNGLFTLDPGDLNALAALLPGMVTTDSGYSAFGAPSGQNKVIVDGSDFGGSSLPRDAIGRSKVITNTFDPSKGQFAGGETVVSTRAGSTNFASTLRTQLIDPHLAWADPQSPVPLPRIGYASGFLTGGPGTGKKFYYILSFDLNDRVTDVPSLLAPRATLLSQLGISTDSVAAVTHALSTLGVPLTSGAIPAAPTALQGSASLRADYRIDAKTSFTLSIIGGLNRASGTGISELAFPSGSSEVRSENLRVQVRGGTYIHRVLDNFNVTYAPQSFHVSPYTALPTGYVQVGTVYADGRIGLSGFRFGGGGSGESRSNSSVLDMNHETSWSTPNTWHQLKLTEELRFDRGNSVQTLNQYGGFTYQTLADLTANRPSSYSRTLSSTSLSNRATIVGLSLGDTWHAIPGKLDFQGGVRFDSRTFGTAPGYNATVDSAFGLRTDHVPSDQGFSPRLGFSWSPWARKNTRLPDGMTIITASGGGMARGGPSPMDASGLTLLAKGEDVSFTGGIGAYRGIISPSRIGALPDATGLPTTTQYLSCVGSATPVPTWTSLAGSVPDACADGTGATAFAALQPRVTVFDPAFRAPVSWRAIVQVRGWRVGGWAVAPQVTYSVGINSESWFDRNLRRTAVFTLSGEANRPVFANASDIVPSTGLFAPDASSLTSAYGRVMNVVSDLHYHAAQLTVPFAPPRPLFGKVPVYFVYSFNSQRREQRGFGGTTAGDPFATEWVDGQQAMHQFIVGATNMKVWWFTWAMRLNVLSSMAYTPVVAQDINGDGLSNDRAFIANPATVADTALARQMSALVAAAPGGARDCLQAQFGVIAGTNSCRTPWQAQLDLNLAFTPPQSFGAGSRLRITTTLLNAGGALVRLFGLENTPLGTSSASTNVDPRLLYVTGFDPVNQRFKYKVNQLFGEPLDYGTTRRRYPPFQLQVGVEYRFGYPPTAQIARNAGVFSASGDTAGLAAQVRVRLTQLVGGDPVARILAYRDSLALTPDQISSLDAISRDFAQRLDSIQRPAIAYMVSRGKKLTNDEYINQQIAVGTPSRVLSDAAKQKAIAFLLPEQRAKYEALTARRN